MKRILCTLTSLSLSGCLSTDPVQSISDQDLIERRLRTSADKAARAQEELARFEAARTPRVITQVIPVNDIPMELKKHISLTWDGPLEALVRKLSLMIGYKIQTMGKTPAVPIVVTIDEREKAVGDIIRNIGHQARGKADLHLFPSKKTIEVRYAPTRS